MGIEPGETRQSFLFLLRFSGFSWIKAPWGLPSWRTCLPLQETWETRVRSLGQEDPNPNPNPWRRKWQPLQHSRLENPMDRGAWRAIVLRVTQGQTRLEWLNTHTRGLPWWYSGFESVCQCRGHRFDPGPEKVPHVGEQQTPCTATTEAHVPYRLCSATREATAMRSLHTAMKRSPCSWQLGKPVRSKDPAQPQRNKVNK